MRTGFVQGLHDRFRRGRGDLVAPGTLGTGEQQQVFVLGGGLGEVGVRTRRGDARLFHHACVLRQPLARDLAGVGHAYPSPIG
ncbi:hypothetical protein BN159_7029 [Streptomyces davaonensis JCM 4913]|uniref:Uncharacterized protein n=1 Tax=Streptomyces davaonensis (strain DSM 101723 / JCM 4913 / KCC S-0913 / 768) TaxID=1214101 RepID=K4RCS1_STRDJ|nr:hypothetical protein BN159_7029 [Streptomyces davaonensis JCM 4913]